MNNTIRTLSFEELKNCNESEFYFDGLYFKKDYRGYFRCWTKHKGLRLHRYVWEKENGQIPEGYEIHHRDGNKSNNHISNLELLTAKEHSQKHVDEFNRNKKKNMPSLEWRKQNYNNTKHLMHEIVEKQCLFCGTSFKARKYAKYCSKTCNNKYNNLKRKLASQE